MKIPPAARLRQEAYRTSYNVERSCVMKQLVEGITYLPTLRFGVKFVFQGC